MIPSSARSGLGCWLLIFTLAACSKEARTSQSLEKAGDYVRNQQYEAAAIEYRNALDTDPGNAEAAQQLGIIRLGQGAYYEAARYLSFAVQERPQDPEAAQSYATALLNLGFLADSRRELNRVLEQDPNAPEALILMAETSLTPEWTEETRARLEAADPEASAPILAKALLELRAGAIESGASLVGKVLAQDPDSSQAHGLQASILKSRGQLEASLDELRQAAELAGSRSSKTLHLNRELVARGQLEEAHAMLQTVVGDEPDYLPARLELAQVLVAKDETKAAMAELETILRADPFNLNAGLIQSELLARTEELDQAKVLLDRLSEAFPGRLTIELARAKIAFQQDELERSASLLEPFLDPERGSIDARVLRARIHLKMNEGRQAVQILEPIHQQLPERSELRDLLITAHRQAGDREAELALLRQKAEHSDDSTDTQVELAQTLQQSGRFEEAEPLLEQLLEEHPDLLPAVALLVDLQLRTERPELAMKTSGEYAAAHSDSSAAHSLFARVALATGDVPKALEALHTATELDPGNRDAQQLLVQLSLAEGANAEALATLERYLEHFPDDSAMALQYGIVLQQLGRSEPARQAFLDLTQSHPDFALGYNNLAELENSVLNLPEEAREHARKARELAPDEAAIADTLGWVEWRLGNYPEALPLLREAAAGLPNLAETHYRLGRAYQSMGQAEQAAESFAHALRLPSAGFPNHGEAERELEKLHSLSSASLEELEQHAQSDRADLTALLGYADALAEQGQADAARAQYQEALDRNPSLVAAWTGIAELHLGPLADPQKASEAATKARELDPRHPRVLGVVGLSLLASGDATQAYGRLKDALIGRESAALRSGFARAAFALGRVEEAREAMERVSEAGSLPADAQRFLRLTDPETTTPTQEDIDAELARHPHSLCGRFALARKHLQDGDTGEAVTLLEALIDEYPEFDPARLALIPVFAGQPGKERDALELAKDIRSRRPDDLEFAARLAALHFLVGEHSPTIRLLDGLARGSELDADQWFMLGISQWKTEQPDEAETSLARALEGELTSDQQGQARQALEEIRGAREEQDE